MHSCNTPTFSVGVTGVVTMRSAESHISSDIYSRPMSSRHAAVFVVLHAFLSVFQVCKTQWTLWLEVLQEILPTKYKTPPDSNTANRRALKTFSSNLFHTWVGFNWQMGFLNSTQTDEMSTMRYQVGVQCESCCCRYSISWAISQLDWDQSTCRLECLYLAQHVQSWLSLAQLAQSDIMTLQAATASSYKCHL